MSLLISGPGFSKHDSLEPHPTTQWGACAMETVIAEVAISSSNKTLVAGSIQREREEDSGSCFSQIDFSVNHHYRILLLTILSNSPLEYVGPQFLLPGHASCICKYMKAGE